LTDPANQGKKLKRETKESTMSTKKKSMEGGFFGTYTKIVTSQGLISKGT